MPGNNSVNTLANQYGCLYSQDDDKYFFPLISVTGMDVDTQEDTDEDGSINILDMLTQVQNEINDQAESIGDAASVVGLKEKMKKFVFPPRYDFVNNENPAIR